VWGVRFNKEKSPGQRRGSETRWLTPEQAGLVRPAIEEVLRLTEPARARARVLGGVPTHGATAGRRSWHGAHDGRSSRTALRIARRRAEGHARKAGTPSRRRP
jgi:hypothetical protein